MDLGGWPFILLVAIALVVVHGVRVAPIGLSVGSLALSAYVLVSLSICTRVFFINVDDTSQLDVNVANRDVLRLQPLGFGTEFFAIIKNHGVADAICLPIGFKNLMQ